MIVNTLRFYHLLVALALLAACINPPIAGTSPTLPEGSPEVSTLRWNATDDYRLVLASTHSQ